MNSLLSSLGDQLEYVVSRRQSNWDYLKRAHTGRVHWLNVMKLSKSVIVRSFPPEKLAKRIRRWFMLGLSFGRLLELNEGPTLVRALGQLIEEFEHHISSGSKKDVKGALEAAAGIASTEITAPLLFIGSALASAHVQAVVAAAAAQQAQSASSSSQGAAEVKPQLRKVGKEVVYEFLQTTITCTPDNLDYCEIVNSLCDVLSLLYSKFLDPSCQPPPVHDAILRIDRKLKVLVLTKITNDLTTEVAAPMLKAELKTFLNHSFADDRNSTPQVRKYIQLDPNGADEQESDADEDQ